MSNDNEIIPLEQVLFNSKDKKYHVLLIGEGGMGKTVSLLKICEIMLSKEIPCIYISARELIKVKSIEEYMHENLFKNLSILEDIFYEDVYKYAKTNSKRKACVLLIDGYNEVDLENRAYVQRMIKEWIPYSVQIVLTSRYDFRDCDMESFEVYNIQPLNKKQIQNYLLDCGIYNKNLDSNLRLYELLTNPLILTLYAYMVNIKNEYITNINRPMEFVDIEYIKWKDMCNQGSIIWNFIQCQILIPKRGAESEGDNKVGLKILDYAIVLRYIVPFIGYYLWNTEQFSIDKKKLYDIIDNYNSIIIKKWKYKKPYDIEELEMFLQERYNVTEEIEITSERIFKNKIKIVQYILKELHILNEIYNSKNVKYEFWHQNFRDCLAAIHLLNDFDVNLGKNNKSWKKSMDMYIINYLSDLCEEDFLNEIWNSLKDKKQVPKLEHDNYIMYNLTEIFKIRNNYDLSNISFDNMSLSKVKLRNCNLWNKNSAASFCNTFISEEAFLPIGHIARVISLDWKDDQYLISASYDQTIQIWNVKLGKREKKINFKGFVEVVCFSPDGKYFAVGLSNSQIIIWDDNTYQIIKVFKKHKSWISDLCWLKDSKHIVSIEKEGTVYLWNIITGKYKILKNNTIACKKIILSTYGTYLFSCSDKNHVLVWDANNGSLLDVGIIKTSGQLTCIANYSKDEYTIVYGTDIGQIGLWNWKAKHLEENIINIDSVINVITSHIIDDSYIAFGTDNSKLGIWNSNTHTPQIIALNSGPIKCLSFSSNGCYLGIGTKNQSIIIWNQYWAIVEKKIDGNKNGVRAIDILNKNKLIASGSDNGHVILWNLITGEKIETIDKNTNSIGTIKFSPNGSLLAFGLDNGSIYIWDLKRKKILQKLNKHKDWIRTILWNQSQTKLLSCADDKQIIIWDVVNWTEEKIMIGHTDWVRTMQWSKDFKKLASCSYDQNIVIWNMENLAIEKILCKKMGSANAIAWKETYVAVGYMEGILQIWDTQNDLLIFDRKISNDIIRSVIWCMNGRYIVVGTTGGNLIFVEYENYDISNLYIVNAHIGAVNMIICDENRQFIITASDDGTIKKWLFKSKHPIEIEMKFQILIFQDTDLRECSFINCLFESNQVREKVLINGGYIEKSSIYSEDNNSKNNNTQQGDDTI